MANADASSGAAPWPCRRSGWRGSPRPVRCRGAEPPRSHDRGWSPESGQSANPEPADPLPRALTAARSSSGRASGPAPGCLVSGSTSGWHGPIPPRPAKNMRPRSKIKPENISPSSRAGKPRGDPATRVPSLRMAYHALFGCAGPGHTHGHARARGMFCPCPCAIMAIRSPDVDTVHYILPNPLSPA
jgi:hypothetical protein